MRICYLSDFFVPYYHGGGERRYYEIAKRLVKKGHSVDIVCMRIKGVPDEEQIDGISIHHVGPVIAQPPHRKLFDFFKFLHAQKHWLKNHDYDIIEAQGVSILNLLWVKLFLNKPTIALIHDVSSGSKDQWFSFRVLSSLYEKIITMIPCRKILTVGNGTKNQLVKQYGVDEQKIKVVHNGVDLKLIDSVKSRRVNQNSVIFVGRLIPHKHVDDLLRVFGIVSKKIKNAKLKIIGTGLEEEKLRKIVVDLKLKNVNFVGAVKDYVGIISAIKQSTILALPSTREGFGIVLAEANACGKPVVAYDIEGVRDVVQSSKNGILSTPCDIDAFAKSIIELLANEKLCVQMGRDGRKRVETLFTWEKATDELERFYSALTL